MIPRECKRLAEVDFPIAKVSEHAVREKSIRHGHPSVLHLWWARRPLASSRAMLTALLLPDPCDPICPESFKSRARELLHPLANMSVLKPGDAGLREGLLQFIADFSNWELCTNRTYVEVGQQLVKAAHPEETPLVVDPFAGGGSIPLEALRLGCETFASDLNPVACLILKVMLEGIPRYREGLIDELRHAGGRVRADLQSELKEFYPPDPNGAIPIAYLWARTVRCEDPHCGAEIPLVRSFWLSTKPRRRRALRYAVVREPEKAPKLVFEVFEPSNENDVQPGTVSRSRAVCPSCGAVLLPERVVSQLVLQKGGADVLFDAGGGRHGGATLLAVATLEQGSVGRKYRAAEERDYQIVQKAQQALKEVVGQSANEDQMYANEPLPPPGTLGFRVQRYGMRKWADVFTSRQRLALGRLCEIVAQSPLDSESSPARALLAFCVSKCADLNSSLSHWKLDAECPVNTFTRHALPINWDFAESVPISDSTGSFASSLERTIAAMEATDIPGTCSGSVELASAEASPLPSESVSVWFTDPPYYDAIPYADLSDFFFVWLKRALPKEPILRDPFDSENPLTPKLRELVQNPKSKGLLGEPKDRGFYERGMASSFAEGRRLLSAGGLGCVVFAHKTTEGWEALLSGIIKGGWVVVGSWPIAT